MNTIIKKMVLEDIAFNHNGKVSLGKCKEIIKITKTVWGRIKV
jgi:hypothetical protein